MHLLVSGTPLGREAVGEREEARHIPGVGAEEVDAKSSLLSGRPPSSCDHSPLPLAGITLKAL